MSYINKAIKFNSRILNVEQYKLPAASDYRHKLDVIENHFPLHPSVTDLHPQHLHLYPHIEPDTLIKKIKNYLQTPAPQIVLTNGSDNALKLIVDTYLGPEANVLLVTPTYPHMENFIKLSGANIDYLDISLTEPDIESLISDHLAADPDFVYLCNPNLPLGYQLTRAAIVQQAQAHPSTLFVVDEAYYEFGLKESVAGTADNIIVTRTFSKLFGLAALRLGYIVCADSAANLLLRSHNPKNVTDLAIMAASASLDHIDHYLAIEIEYTAGANFIRAELARICRPDAPIYGYNVAHGNYYLLLCADTAYVCRVFAQHKIYVRDKHADVPHAVRICLSTEDANRDVIRICRLINMKSILSHMTGPIIVDMDGTLRPNAKDDAEPAPGALSLMNRLGDRAIILSNNGGSDGSWASRYFNCKFMTSLDIAIDHIRSQHLNLYVVGSPYVKSRIPDPGPPYDGVLMVNDYFLALPEIIRICDILPGKPLYTTDTSLYCTLDMCSDSGPGTTVIPDLGSYAKLFMGICSQIIPLCKPMMNIECEMVIGDSTSDLLLAKNNQAECILIGDTPSYDFDGEFYVAPLSYLVPSFYE